MKKQYKAVVLLSGGLDSMLAAKLLIDQGLHVEAINFYTGFCHSGHTSAIRNKKHSKPKRNDALWCAEQLGIKLHIIDVVEEYEDVVINPKYGYGKNINPCLDCKIFMVRRAVVWMQENNFDFIATGEVVGQRPKSQRKDTMAALKKQSQSSDLLLRPLCAQLLEPTLPEREGWVDRSQLLGIHGRGRKAQLTLAQQYGFVDHAQPSGGCCVLTDESYTSKLQDMWQHRGEKQYSLDDIIMLKVGRHLRLKPNLKLIVAREQGENNFLEGYRKRFTYLRSISHEGPLTLLEGEANQDDLQLAARIVGRFSKGRDAEKVTVQINHCSGLSNVIHVEPLANHELDRAWYI